MTKTRLLANRQHVLLSLPILVLLFTSGCQYASQGMNVDGVRLHQQGSHQQATQRFIQAIANDPSQADGYYNLAATFHQVGRLQGRKSDLEQAENLYNQCLDRDPNHTECYRGLAVLLADTDRSDAALRLLEGWATRSPASPEPKIELARLLEEIGEPEQAKQQLVAALAIEPNNSRGLSALGRLREFSGEPQQALANYERSLALDQFQPQVAARVATLQTAVGRPAGASPASNPSRLVRKQPQFTRY